MADPPPKLHGYDCSNLRHVKKFVESGGDTNMPIEGFLGQVLPPLHWAVFYQSTEIVEYLLQHGADRHAVNKKGLTVRQVALVRGAPPAIMHLLEN